MDVKIHSSWKTRLQGSFQSPYFAQLAAFVKQEYQKHQVFPPPKEIFHAFELSPFEHTKVVVLGQDPYHGRGQAHGLSFSVREGIPRPPSLQNIFLEIKDDIGTPISPSGDLSRWARQGVLLLNAVLTVRERTPASHAGKGWENFTDDVISLLNREKEHLVFMLWGAYAQRKGAMIDRKKHLVLSSPHPSPFSAHRGFLGNKHFSQANTYLKAQGLSPIAW